MLYHTHGGSVRVANSDLQYVSFGTGEKTAVLLPGLSDGLANVKGKAFLLVWPYIKYLKQFTVYMFSRKDDLKRGCTIEEMADEQAEALEQLGIREAYVLGVSQGGMIAQALAVRHPQLVKAMVVAVSAPCANEIVMENLDRWEAFAKKKDHQGLMADTAEKSYSEKCLKKYRMMIPLLGLAGKPESYERFFANMDAIRSFDLRKEIGRIHCPVLVIGGEEDKTVGVNASYMIHEAIKGSELYVYPDLGHAAYEEAADFNERVFGFFEKHQKSRT